MLQGLNESRRDSLIATGFFKADETGEHTVGILSAGKSRIFINQELIVDNWTAPVKGDAFFSNASTELQASVSMQAGQSYAVRIEYDADPASTFKAMRYGILGPDTEQGLTRALEIARNADAVILMVGTNDDWETEGNDREMLSLPGGQDELIRQVCAANPKTIVVNNSGSPVSMPWLDGVPAMIQTWFAGQEFGHALMDLITGKSNPSGKLPITFPHKMSDTPAFTSYPGEFGKVHYGEGLFVGYRWYDSRETEPLLPFGFGLSYTSFEFSDLSVEPNGLLSCHVTNTGQYQGKETVQVYIEPLAPTVARPLRELKAFTKVDLMPGESKTVALTLGDDAFAHWDISQQSWQVATGDYRVHVGNSSRHLPLSKTVSR